LELELVQGAILSARSLETSKQELKDRTPAVLWERRQPTSSRVNPAILKAE
jgi:hypothetical protein